MQVPINDAPVEVQALVLQAEPMMLKVFAECCSLGEQDVVIDLKRRDVKTVTVSVCERERFRELLISVDPTNPFIEKLRQSFGTEGFWVSIRTENDHYIYPVSTDKSEN